MQLDYTQQTRRSYADFHGQIDSLVDRQVIWTLYTVDAITTRAPQGLSSLCFRYQQYWLMKKPVVYDVYVEEYHPECVMRQFGLYQESPMPVVHTVAAAVHR